MAQMEVAALRSHLEDWRAEAQIQTRDMAYDLTDLEWLGGRIAALNDVLALLSAEKPLEQNLRARLLGDEGGPRASRVQTASETEETQTRSRLST
jgi:hypothetical protein